jgi:hypothetical protein
MRDAAGCHRIRAYRAQESRLATLAREVSGGRVRCLRWRREPPADKVIWSGSRRADCGVASRFVNEKNATLTVSSMMISGCSARNPAKIGVMSGTSVSGVVTTAVSDGRQSSPANRRSSSLISSRMLAAAVQTASPAGGGVQPSRATRRDAPAGFARWLQDAETRSSAPDEEPSCSRGSAAARRDWRERRAYRGGP